MFDENKIEINDVFKPTGDVAIAFMDKLEKVGAYIFPSIEIKESKAKAYSNIIDEISRREDINPIERMAIISNFKKIVKEFSNQTDIVRAALEHLNADAKPEEIEDDWLNNFFDKARLVSDEQLKIMWGKLLAEEANSSGTVSKQLIHILSVMSSNDANLFKKLGQFSFYIETTDKDFPTAIIYDQFKKFGLCFADLTRCEKLGLITINGEFTLYKESVRLKYGEKQFSLIYVGSEGNKYIDLGMVMFSDEARTLLGILDREYSQDIYDYNMEVWQNNKNLQVIIEE